MLAIAKALEQVSRPLRLPEWGIITLYENVVMDEEDLDGSVSTRWIKTIVL